MAFVIRFFAVVSFLLALAQPALCLNLGDIVTKAGGIGDGGSASAGNLYYPSGVALDGNGNVYISDRDHNRIRKIDAATGIITTVAGNGAYGYSGDNGKASEATLNAPTGIAVDSSGNIYIADESNHRVRKVTASTGVITTVAGLGTASFGGDNGPAASAYLNRPRGLAFDASGNLYISDRNNNRVRKITASTGIITTVAGNGTGTFAGDGGAAAAASIYMPAGLALDSAGNLYIADGGNDRVRKVTASTGIISTVVVGTVYAIDVTDVKVDNSGNLFFTDYLWHRVKKMDTSGVITTVAGGGGQSTSGEGFAGDGGAATSAALNYPTGVALGAEGDLYIADQYNHRVRKVSAATGIITTLTGYGLTGFSGDGGAATLAAINSPKSVVADAVGNIYIADKGNNRIRKVAAGTGIITTVAGDGTAAFTGDGGPAASARISGPSGTAVDGNGNLYFSDTGNHRIRRIDAATGVITTVAGTGSAALAGDGGPARDAALNNPLGIALDGSGNLFIADNYNHRIRKVAAGTGIITTVAGIGTSSGYGGDGGAATDARLGYPSTVTFDRNGNLLIADVNNSRVRMVSVDTGIITTVAGNGSYGETGDGGPATAARIAPSGVAVDAGGNMYISGSYNRLRKVDAATGIITTVAGNGIGAFGGDGGPATSAFLNAPQQISFDSVGNLYLADFNSNAIRKIYYAAVPTTVNLASSAPGSSATAGDAVTFTASVTSTDGVPSGEVTFTDGAGILDTVPLNGSGEATFTTSALAAGSHSISAAYGASGIHAGATSAPLTQWMNATAADSHTLTVPFAGTGTGHVATNPAPPGIVCGSSCGQSFPIGTSVTLTASADADSYFAGWSGCDAVSGSVCSLALTSDRTATATFHLEPPIYLGLSRAAFNGTLQQAYDSLLPGSGLLWLRVGSADGSLICDREVQLRLQGGWKSSLNTIAGRTYLDGALKVKAGTVSIGELTFR